jgi:2-(1,2-epoxy-1,2-dihydrophenyl)acetyl-CoA isomerase
MLLDTGTDVVLAEVTDGVGIVTLNRPERRNALHPDMFDVVPRVLEQFVVDPEVGCILITGAGTAFCAGGDVRGDPPYEGPTDRAAEILAGNARMVVMLHDAPKISIAALPGPAVGAGLGIALAADLRIASASARLIPGWGKLAFSGDFGGTWLLSRLLGPARALELLINDTALTADEALALGLVNRVVPDGELRDSALDWARTIAAGPRTAYGYMKANVQQASVLGLGDALLPESERMVRSGRTEEHRAAVKAWLQTHRSTRTEKPSSILDR